jgi:hypothetical protein
MFMDDCFTRYFRADSYICCLTSCQLTCRRAKDFTKMSMARHMSFAFAIASFSFFFHFRFPNLAFTIRSPFTMATEGMETRHKGAIPTLKEAIDPEAPSGFILKLFQMVENAPNEVISVSALRAVHWRRSCERCSRPTRGLQ